MKHQEKILNIVTITFLVVLTILSIIEICYHVSNRKQNDKVCDTIVYDTDMPFQLYNVLDIKEAKDNEGYQIKYHNENNDSTIVMFTSIIEGDYLKTYYDCLDLYSANQSEEDIDNLNSYLLNNSRIKYVNNPWYVGYIWIYDSCPIYRFPSK